MILLRVFTTPLAILFLLGFLRFFPAINNNARKPENLTVWKENFPKKAWPYFFIKFFLSHALLKI